MLIKRANEYAAYTRKSRLLCNFLSNISCPSLSNSMATTSISPSPPAKPHRDWLELPAELTSSILQRVGTAGVLMSARKVCKSWRTICSDPAMWRVVNLSFLGSTSYLNGTESSLELEMEKMARKVVDLSCGELIDFSAEDFVSDDLLRYISDRYNNFLFFIMHWLLVLFDNY